jgi:hypothetical protein
VLKLSTSGSDQNHLPMNGAEVSTTSGTKGTHRTWADVVRVSTHVNELNKKKKVKSVLRSFSRNNSVSRIKV